jgi:hypothetical protein
MIAAFGDEGMGELKSVGKLVEFVSRESIARLVSYPPLKRCQLT